ncbi:MAG: class I tRNA ligase family protein, partial [Clostridia bacterium]|nr:class I tRNA ligase family protein [Clostridia bacterium]
LSAPFVPFMAEEMYQNIVRTVDKNAPESVHLCSYPEADESYIDPELEVHMDEVLDIVVLGRAARNGANIKNRQPIGKMYVQGAELPELFVSIVADELNVKAVEFVADASSFISYRTKPQLKTLGPRYGKILKDISAHLATPGVGDTIVATHNAGETYRFELNGQTIELGKDDVLVETMQKEGFASETDHDMSVVLDTNLTPELIDEGMVREIGSKVQTMRKEAGFEVTDHITITYEGTERIVDIFGRFGSEICEDTLADEAVNAEPKGYVKDWDINGEKVKLGVEKR